MNRERRSQREWQELMVAWQNSGELSEAFAARKGVRERTLVWWRSELKRRRARRRTAARSVGRASFDLSSALPRRGPDGYVRPSTLRQGAAAQLRRCSDCYRAVIRGSPNAIARHLQASRAPLETDPSHFRPEQRRLPPGPAIVRCSYFFVSRELLFKPRLPLRFLGFVRALRRCVL